MKIIGRDQFLALPSHAVYSKYTDENLEELSVKQDTVPSGTDFRYQGLVTTIDSEGPARKGFCLTLSEAASTGLSVAMDFESSWRDGLFEEDQLFAVWEEADIRGLIGRLQQCLPKDAGG